jgi:hypothetical protein
MALAQFGTRFKIGYHHAQLIEYFLDRASNPSFEKLAAHYPEHPRPGAPELHPGCDLGRCIINALNIKRGYWRLPKQAPPAGISPFESTPESVGQGSTSGASNSAGAGAYNRYGPTSTTESGSGSGSGTGKGVANGLGSVSDDCSVINVDTTSMSTADTGKSFPFFPAENQPTLYQHGVAFVSEDMRRTFYSLEKRQKERGGGNHSVF